MYLTPIIYPASLVMDLSKRIGGLFGSDLTIFDIYTWNPMFHFVAAFRQLLYDNRWLDAVHLVTCSCWTVAAVIAGVMIFSRNEKKIAEAL